MPDKVITYFSQYHQYEVSWLVSISYLNYTICAKENVLTQLKHEKKKWNKVSKSADYPVWKLS